jgi:glycosyltransferase involved in cell wall biosynthesis
VKTLVERQPARRLKERARHRAWREIHGQLEWAREWLSTLEERRLLGQARGDGDVCWTEGDEAEPLVTVRIATHPRTEVTVGEAIESAVRQTYGHLEILVVGECADRETEAVVRSFRDPRVRFVNLAFPGLYPNAQTFRRKVAGAHPMNAALYLASGHWISPCDDDDTLTDDHVEVLLQKAKSDRLEMVYSRSRKQQEDGTWIDLPDAEFRRGGFTHGSVLYSGGLRFMQHSLASWLLHNEPSDWNLWKRMHRAGVRIGFCDAVTYNYGLSALEKSRRPEPRSTPG